MSSARYYWQILLKLELSREIFEKYLNTTFHENLFSGNLVPPPVRTDEQPELIVVFRNYANTPKNTYKINFAKIWRIDFR